MLAKSCQSPLSTYRFIPVKSRNTHGMTGARICQRKKTTIRTKTGAYCSSIIRPRPYWFGMIEKRILEPSRGGNGMRLKMARTILMMTMYEKIIRTGSETVPPADKNLMIVPNMRASKRFEPGPAAAIKNSPCLLFLRLYGLYGTGLAQPNVNPAREVIRGTMIEPIGSMCLSGFKVNRPESRAVGSPSRSAM